MFKSKRPKPVILLILDGWGYREENEHNAIALAKTPYWDHLIQICPHTLLTASGLSVGLPGGQMGNSEVGHLTIGAGRVLYQDLTRINKSIETGDFFKNEAFVATFKKANTMDKSVHILGLLSPGGIHSHEKHIYALLQLASLVGLKNCYIHVFLDGRDTAPKSAQTSIIALENKCKEFGVGKIASLIGRYYAMDRDKRWERTQAAYDCLTSGKAQYNATTALEGLQQAYARGETDEFVKPTCVHPLNSPAVKIQENDSVIFMNFRADRARQLSRAFLNPGFSEFKRHSHPRLSEFISLTQYAADIPSHIAFPKQSLENGLAEYLAKKGLTQLRIAETEKYAHVTFFFNGGIETPFPNETRLLIPSKKVATYDLTPKMSAFEITDRLLEAIEEKKYDVIICNFANPDMLGHTGNIAATEEAITYIDQCIDRIITALKKQGGEAIITADHGNAEHMYDEKTQQAHTAHTTEPVPFIYVGRPAKIKPQHIGTLADIAPTLLALLELPKPKEMTGENLIIF
ncbi:MAG: 2,3-bisphosphoglycerate-independent phosphoglycerate mutase [Rickettsiella sp.]|nr:2,3-bisphosphoglycerate-independent phosphoglycerate mutase [Rickettsiella sp.]